MTEDVNNITVYDVANAFITKFKEENKKLSHKKLQKLVYLAYGFYLSTFNRRLFIENFEAWPHGPVCRDLYFKIKGSDNSTYNITNTLSLSCNKEQTEGEGEKNKEQTEEEIRVNKVVNYINKHFGNWDANKLEDLTHQEGSAWSKVKNNNELDIQLKDCDIISEINKIITQGS